MEGKAIYAALMAVQRDLKAPKSNRNSFGKYNYRSKAGFHLLDVDWWDLPIYDEYTLTFSQGDYGDVRVVLLEADKYSGAVRKQAMDMNAGHFEHVAQVLEDKEAQEHAAV